MTQIRQAVRALLVTPDPRILLMKLRLRDPGREIWIAPGGGIEDGEDSRIALGRELFEETGNREITIGPMVWRRQHTFRLEGREICQYEEFYLCRTPEFEAVPVQLNGPLEKDCFRELRWWSLHEIGRSAEWFVPRNLFEELTKLLTDNGRAYPIDVGH